MGTALFEASLAREGHWVGELVHTARDGRRVVVESRQEVLREPDGRLLVLETNRDIGRAQAGRGAAALDSGDRAGGDHHHRRARPDQLVQPGGGAAVRLPCRGGGRPQRQHADAGAPPGEPRRLSRPLPCHRRAADHRHRPRGRGPAQGRHHLPDGARGRRGACRRRALLYRLRARSDRPPQAGAGAAPVAEDGGGRASSRAAWRTTSTTCSPSSSAISRCSRTGSPIPGTWPCSRMPGTRRCWGPS